jgi:DNA-binding NarL/FixJ family response regulator
VSRAPRVVIADCQPTMRATVKPLLEGDGFMVCGEASDAISAVDATLLQRPDLCLIDVLMPGGGIRATKRITTELTGTAVVILTASEQRGHLVDAIRAGAVGYLPKSMNPERLPKVLRGVLAGEAAIPRTLVARLLGELQTQGRRRVIAGERGRVDLTSREWEVMELICDGLRTGEIAERLFVSPVTVRRHTSEIVRKFGVEDREAAVAVVEGQI